MGETELAGFLEDSSALFGVLAEIEALSRTITHPPTSAAVPVCNRGARDAVARFLGVAATRVVLAVSTGTNAMPQCSFSVPITAGQRILATANVDTSPQPYMRLERTSVETDQAFVGQAGAVPQVVTGIGVDAYWFPSKTQLMGTDGVRLLTVSVSWRGAVQRRDRALAEALARAYLGPVRNPGSSSLFKGYPSPP